MSNAPDERHNVLAERIAHERELREAQLAAFDHERELRAVYDQHERELRLQAEAAVEKARQLQFEIYEQRLEAMNKYREQLTAQARTFLTVDRFEREHEILVAKIGVEERLSIRADASREVLDTLAVNRRWLYGIVVTVTLFGLTTLLHAFGVI